MPEWTGERRQELYQALAAGRLEDALALARLHLDLKRNDLKPIDKAAMAAFDAWLAQHPDAQEQLARLLGTREKGLSNLLALIYKTCTRFDGDILAKVFEEIGKIGNEERLKDQQSIYEISAPAPEPPVASVPPQTPAVQKRPRKAASVKTDKAEPASKPKPWDALLTLDTSEYGSRTLDQILDDRAGPEYAPFEKEILVIQAMRPCPHLDEAIRTMRKIMAERLIAPHYVYNESEEEGKWRLYVFELRFLAFYLETRERIDRELSPHFLPQVENELSGILAHIQNGTLTPKHSNGLGWIILAYFILAPGPDQTFLTLFNTCFSKLPKEQRESLEELRDTIRYYLLRDFDHVAITRPWWGEFILKALLAADKDYYHYTEASWMLYRLEREHQDRSLDSYLVSLETGKAGARNPEAFRKNIKKRYSESEWEILKLLYIRSRGLPALRHFMNDDDLAYYHADLLRQFMPQDPELAAEHLRAMMSRRRNPLLMVTHEYSPNIRRTIFYYLNESSTQAEAVAWLAELLQSGNALPIDTAFRVAFRERAIMERHGYNLLNLTAQGMFQRKAIEAKKAILRIQGLVAHGVCPAAEAAAALEQAFTIEEPMLWRAAAEAIRDLRKQDPAIRLNDPGRVRELLARDPEKYGKFLAPLVD